MRFDNLPVLPADRVTVSGRPALACPSCYRRIVLGPFASAHPDFAHLYRCTCGQLARVAPTAITITTPENLQCASSQ